MNGYSPPLFSSPFKIYFDPFPFKILIPSLRRLGLGTGWFGRVSARSATRPVAIRFGQFQPAMNNKNSKPVGYSDRMDQVCAGGLVRLGQVVRIFPDFLHLSRFHLLHYLPAISLKPTNPALTPPSPSNP
jgi:hypothetical protein